LGVTDLVDELLRWRATNWHRPAVESWVLRRIEGE
jgi:hypothetical protein